MHTCRCITNLIVHARALLVELELISMHPPLRSINAHAYEYNYCNIVMLPQSLGYASQ